MFQFRKKIAKLVHLRNEVWSMSIFVYVANYAGISTQTSMSARKMHIPMSHRNIYAVYTQ